MRISLEEALERINNEVTALSPVTIPVNDALGCILAGDITAQLNQPPFPRSPYDGYALRATDSAPADKDTPVTLKIIGSSFAGVPANVSVGKGEAVRIMTGGVIPDGADCVIMQEHTDGGEAAVNIFERLSPHQNYCFMGEDFKQGEVLAHPGIPVSAAVAAVAASAGLTELSVIPRPYVTVLSTGDELQSAGTRLLPGHIYNSNCRHIAARLRELSVPCTELEAVKDDIDSIISTLGAAAKRGDFVICSGGVSVGEKDLVPEALERMGAKLCFHGVDIKPGMPAALALLDRTPILALSGNPFACAVSFELLARPIIAAQSAALQLNSTVITARLKEAFTKKRPIRRFQRGVLHSGEVSLPGEQGNGQMKTMIGCNCIVELPCGNAPLALGEQVRVYLLRGDIYGT